MEKRSFTAEHREKLRQAKLKNPVRYWAGRKRPEASVWIKKALTGRTSPFKGQHRPELQGEVRPAWKGENVSYRNLHRWVERFLGKPRTCSSCETFVQGKGIHWANKSHLYQRNLTDWVRLCAKCHAAYDHGKLVLT